MESRKMREPKKFWLAFAMVLCVLPRDVNGHLCLIIPRQRGDMDISRGGSPTCFRHGAECGGVPGQYPPSIELMGGQSIFIKWQQNYNHYSVGYPGYMDIGFAVANNGAVGDDPFRILAELPDVYEHDQNHQRNYTAVVTLPNEDCDHCVIRARYNSHKPGETTFYQCADIRVKKSNLTEVAQHQGSLQLLEETRTNRLGQYRTSSPVNGVLMNTLTGIQTPKCEKSFTNPSQQDLPNGSNFNRITPTEASVHPDSDTLLAALNLIKEQSTSTLAVESGNAALSSQPAAEELTTVPKIIAMSNNMESVGGLFYSIDSATGERKLRNFLSFRVDSPYQPIMSALETPTPYFVRDFVTAEVFSFDPGRQVIVLPVNPYGNMDAAATRIVEIDWVSGTPRTHYNISYNVSSSETTPLPFSAIKVEIEGSFATFSIVPSEEEDGKYTFLVGRLHADGKWVELSRSIQSEDLYINFLWAEYDISVKTLYVLLGNENDAYNLTARLYKFFVPPWEPPIGPVPPPVSYVTVDVSQFTISSFHLNPIDTNKLYAVSPGRHGTLYPSYHLVSLDVDTGAISEIMQIAPTGIFASYYGGTVSNGLNPLTHRLLHVLRLADTQGDVIATVDILNKVTTFSQPTSVSNLYNLACTWTDTIRD